MTTGGTSNLGPVGGGGLKLVYNAFPHSRQQLENLRTLAITRDELEDIERIKTAFGVEDTEFGARTPASEWAGVSVEELPAGWGAISPGSPESRAWRETNALLDRVSGVPTDLDVWVDRFYGAGRSGG